MRRHRRILSLLLLTLASGSVAACAGILGFERLHEDGGFVIDSGADVDAGDATAIQPDAAPSACGEIGLTTAPAASDASVGSEPPVIVALKTLDFGLDGNRANAPGYNLDQTCSPTVDTSSCMTNVLDTKYEKYAADITNTGVDNAGFGLIAYISSLSDLITAQNINAGIAHGDYGAVVRISNWNGQPEDDSVAVEVFPAIGLEPRTAPDAGLGPDDNWLIDRRFQVAPATYASNQTSDVAWVTGGQLTARFTSVGLIIKISDDDKPFDIKMSNAILTGKLTTGSDGLTSFTEGVVAGRWKTSDFLGQVRLIHVGESESLSNTTLCENSFGAQLTYNSVKNEVCTARDIRSDSQDHSNLPCDAVSAAARIEGYPVKTIGTFTDAPDGGDRCHDNPAVAAGDDCP